MLSRAVWQGDAVIIKGIEYHRSNDVTVRVNDGGAWRYEGKIEMLDVQKWSQTWKELRSAIL